MDPYLYQAAMDGNNSIVMQYEDQFQVQRTPNNNTVLHIASLIGKATLVESILSTKCGSESLLHQVNANSETPLHIASREGHDQVVAILLVAFAKSRVEFGSSTADMLRLSNNDNDLPLHLAVRYRHLDVVKRLIKEDPQFRHPPNKAMETPLYIAAEKGMNDFVSAILNVCTSPSCTGPNARTALHAAVISNNRGSTTQLLGWKQELAKEADRSGWTPVHYAAYLGHADRFADLLDSDRSLGYIRADRDEDNTPLHIAASRGHINVILKLIEYCPDCFEMVNRRGENVLHCAMVHKEKEVIRFITLECPLLMTILLNQKDVNGNTPLHLLGSEWFESDLRIHHKAESMVFNNKNMTPLDVAYRKKYNSDNSCYTRAKLLRDVPSIVAEDMKYSRSILGCRDVMIKFEDSVENDHAPITVGLHGETISINNEEDKARLRIWIKMVPTHLKIVKIVLSVASIAGFGFFLLYDGNEDEPNHGSRETALKAFAVTDAIAILLSTASLGIYCSEHDRSYKTIIKCYIVALSFILVAIAATMITLVTGIYAVCDSSLVLANACFGGGCFGLVMYGGIAKTWSKYHPKKHRYGHLKFTATNL